MAVRRGPCPEKHARLPRIDSAIEASRHLVDGSRLAQVIDHLLNNAAKYTPDGGRIELFAERSAMKS